MFELQFGMNGVKVYIVIIWNLAVISCFLTSFLKICLEMHAVTEMATWNGEMAKIRQNRQICRADFALTNLTEIRRNRQLGRLGRTQSLETWNLNLNLTSTDSNECRTGSHSCASNADCVNTIGSYDCECEHGFQGNGWYCSGKMWNINYMFKNQADGNV